MTTDTYTKDKRVVIGWVAAAIGSAALAIAGWAHAKLWSHEVSIERQEERSKAVEQRFCGSEKRLDQMDAKLDKILEEMRRRP
jgi:hypothetical protein